MPQVHRFGAFQQLPAGHDHACRADDNTLECELQWAEARCCLLHRHNLYHLLRFARLDRPLHMLKGLCTC